jgi:DNA-directed RNA polymerase specialized sigma24 family protein
VQIASTGPRLAMPDLDLYLPAIRAGDSTSFGRWVAGAEHPVRASLARFATSVDTEAVLQEAMLRVWQVAPRFAPDGKPNSLLRLAVRAAKNLAISETRKSRAEPTGEDLERSMTDDELVALGPPPDPWLRKVIDECRRKLPGKPLQALEARLANAAGEPDEALAERLRMRLNTFLQNFTRARKLLAECLKKRGVDLNVELP